jgi:capsular polysaccharide biosynthesis protein
MKQGLDMKRLALLLRKRIWIVLVSLAGGAAAGALIYLAVTNLGADDPGYLAKADYYLTFNTSDYPEGVDYYNAYTWDSILRDDVLVEKVMGYLPQKITEDEVKAAAAGEMLGDYRVLTVNITAPTKEAADTIAEAYEQALVEFGEENPLFTSIEIWDKNEAQPVEKQSKTGNAAFLGGLIGCLLALFLVLGRLLLEDAFYVEKDARMRFPQPVLGLTTAGGDAALEKRLQENLEQLFGSEPVTYWDAEKIPAKEDMERLRQSSHVVLKLPWGRDNGRQTEELLEQFKLQQVKIEGLVIVRAEDGFIRAYYGRRKEDNR